MAKETELELLHREEQLLHARKEIRQSDAAANSLSYDAQLIVDEHKLSTDGWINLLIDSSILIIAGVVCGMLLGIIFF